MKLDQVKRLAADVLKVGVTRIWIDPEQIENVTEVITKDDVRALIEEGVIKKRKIQAQSRARARVLAEKKSKGRKKGKGKRKGTVNARTKKKTKWIKTVRAQRDELKKLKEENPEAVAEANYHSVYRKIKGGYYKGRKYVRSAILKK